MDGVNPMYGAPVPSILLIDDDIRLASMVADYLRDHQFEVSHAATGAAALAAIKRQSFDLILLDLMLPDTDGLTLFRELIAHLGQRRSSCSPRGAIRWIRLSGSRSALRIMSRSPSSRASFWRAFGWCFGAGP